MTHIGEPGANATNSKEIELLRYNLQQACSWLRNNTGQLLKPYGITPKQYSILTILASKSPDSSSIQEVRDSLADKMSDASRLIDRLVSKSYIDKFPSEFDRRSNRVRISDSGLKVLGKINANSEDLDRIVSDLLSNKDLTELNRLLSVLK